MSACSALGESTSSLPLASARSISAASRVASAEAFAPFTALAAGFTAGAALLTGRAWALLTVCACALGRRAVLAAAVLGEDINLVPFLDDLVLAQLELAVGHALAGLHVVFVAVPGTDEMHLGIRE